MENGYYLSIEQTDLTQRREGWKRKKRSDFMPDVTWIGIDQAPEDLPGGLVARITPDGTIVATLPMWGVEGICLVDDALLCAGPWTIWKTDKALSAATPWTSAPWCNYLHTLRPHVDGVLVAATGADALFDLNLADASVLWQWWAEDHGFPPHTAPAEGTSLPTGELRGYKIDTHLHRTHVNAAIVWSSHHVLATLFHQGMLVAIDRHSGAVTPLLTDLKRPHGVRRVSQELISLANTGQGEALLVEIDTTPSARIAGRVGIETTWLQDAVMTGEGWLLVDGKNARVVHCTQDGRVTRVDQFDADWRLFEVLPSP